jgi:hypothetical protein
MAFAQAILSSAVLPKPNALRVPIVFHTAQKKVEHLAFLDCGATECFISQRFVDQHKLGVHLMKHPQKLQNADGSPNARGGLTHYTELEVLTGDKAHLLKFYIANMGGNDIVFGYPWLITSGAQPNWAEGTLPVSVIIHTKGVASRKPMHSVQVAGMRTTIQNQPLLQDGDELYLHIVQIDPAQATKTTVAQQLVEQAMDKTQRTWDQIVPPQYHTHAKVFSEDAAQRVMVLTLSRQPVLMMLTHR